jgi:rhomboid protease GluP
VSEQPGSGQAPLPGTRGAEPPQQYAPPAVRPREVSEAVLITESMLADKRIDFEKGMRYGQPLTILLILTLIGVFIWQLASGALSSLESITMSGALMRDRVLAGEHWRLLSAAFLHGGPDHLFGNVISLYILGIGCEHALGARGMAVVFLASALGGSGMSLVLSPGPSVGASGAIFGLMGALILILHRQRDKIFIRDRRIGLVIAVWAGYTFVLGAISPMVDNGAHLGGFIAGALVGGLVPVRLKLPS